MSKVHRASRRAVVPDEPKRRRLSRDKIENVIVALVFIAMLALNLFMDRLVEIGLLFK